MPNRRHLVLVVDEDAAVRDALHFVLRVAGFQVLTYPAGTVLLRESGLSRAQCLVLEERNQQMDPFNLLSHLHARGLQLPAILLTSHRTAALLARARQAGVREVLEKPLFDDILLRQVLLIVGEGTPSTSPT